MALRFSLGPGFADYSLRQRPAECLIALMRTHGANNKMLAKIMGISHYTVQLYLSCLYRVFKCHDRHTLMKKAANCPWQAWEATLLQLQQSQSETKAICS